MIAQQKPMTVEEFLALPDDGNRHEFVRGEVRVMPPPKGDHGVLEFEVLAAIDRYLLARAHDLGWTPDQGPHARYSMVGMVGSGEFGLQFSLPDDPDQIRGADGVYVPTEQYGRLIWDRRSYFPEVPHLVIEIISPSEAAFDINEKVQDYLAGGARRVWCVYPDRATVHVHDVGGPTRVLHRDDTLADEELLPGFALPLQHVFPAAAGPTDRS